MTNPDELRRLAERVERGEMETRDQLRVLALEIANALYGEGAAGRVLIELIENALTGSVDAAKRLMPEGYNVEITLINSKKFGQSAVARCWHNEKPALFRANSGAQDEAHARLALALRVRAEMEESG